MTRKKSHKSLKKDTVLKSVPSGSTFDLLELLPAVRPFPNDETLSLWQSFLSNTSEGIPSPEQMFKRGAAGFCLGAASEAADQISRSIEALKAAEAAPESSWPALLELAWLSVFLVDPALGGDFSEKAVSIHPENSEAWKYRALFLQRDGHIRESIDACQKALELNPSDVRLKESLESLKNGGKMSMGAGMLFPEPDFPSLHSKRLSPSGSFQFNLFILQNGLKLFPDDTGLMFESAMHLFFLGKMQEACDMAEQILSQNSRNADALAFSGFIHEKLGQSEKASALYRRALEIDPAHPFANTNSGRLQFESGSLYKAEYFLQKAVQSAPEYPEALELYGRVLAYSPSEDREGRDPLEFIRKALQFDPENPDFHIHYCLSALQTGQLERLQGEWTYHKKYIQAFSDNGSLRRLLNIVLAGSKEPIQDTAIAEMLNQNGFYETARSFIQKAWKKNYTVEESKQSEFYYYTGLQASRCGEDEAAFEAYQKLAAAEGSGSTAAILSAIALNRLERHKEALALLETCGADNSRILMVRGDVLWSLGRYDEAISAYLQAAEKDDIQKLPLLYGLRYAIRRADSGAVSSFMSAALRLWPDSFRTAAIQGEGLLSLGRPGEAVKTLTQRLFQDGKPHAGTPAQRRQNIEDGLHDAFGMLGYAFIAAGRNQDLHSLREWLQANLPDIFGEWEVLEAERLRAAGELEASLSALTPTNTSIPARITRLLCQVGLGRFEGAEAAARGLLKKREQGRMFYHPAGSPAAVALAILSKVHEHFGRNDAASESAREALSQEPGSAAVKALAGELALRPASGG